MTISIDLAELTRGEVFNLSGHERGTQARQHFQLDVADDSQDEIEVIVPTDVYSLTPSFFQGMFTTSVRRLGNDRTRFLKKYRFKASPLIMRQVDRGLAAISMDRSAGSFS